MRSATACRSWPPGASSTAAASPPRWPSAPTAIWVGTRFIATPEARGVLGYKDKLLASREDQTTVSRAYSGKTMRVVRNEYTDYYDSHPEELKKFPEQLGISYGNGAMHLGGDSFSEGVDVDKECYPAGQGVGAITELVPGGRAGAPVRGRGRGGPRPPVRPALSAPATRCAGASGHGDRWVEPQMTIGSSVERRVALVTGANHGIGAATAKALAAQGAAVLCAYFRNERLGGLDDPSLPAAYRATRMARADFVAESIRAAGGRAAAMEADLSDASSVPALFDAAEAELGPVQILVNNASGWIADTFVPAATEPLRAGAAARQRAAPSIRCSGSTPGRRRS